jgi:hypothetical protein
LAAPVATSAQQQDVNDFVGNNIALIIDILWVIALAGMVASLSFAEWQRSSGNLTRDGQAFTGDSSDDSSGVSLPRVWFLGCTALLSVALLVGGWYGSITLSWWTLILLAILSSLSIIQTIIATRRWMRTVSRRAATPAI